MNPAYSKKLGLRIRQTNVGALKTDGSHLKTFGMVIASFLLQNKLKKVQFYQKTFLIADTQIAIVLRMLFLTLNNADIWFAEQRLVCRTYSAAEVLSTIQRVKIIDKKEFVTTTLNEDNKTFIVYIAALSIIDSNVHPF